MGTRSYEAGGSVDRGKPEKLVLPNLDQLLHDVQISQLGCDVQAAATVVPYLMDQGISAGLNEHFDDIWLIASACNIKARRTVARYLVKQRFATSPY